MGGRVGGILSIRGPEASRRSVEVVTLHAQAPTPHARAHPSVDTYQYRSSASCRAGAHEDGAGPQIGEIFN